MGLLVTLSAPDLALHWHFSCSYGPMMQATFIQKVIICAFLAFLAAGLFEWGKEFVTGADEALNGGYKHTTPADTRLRR